MHMRASIMTMPGNLPEQLQVVQNVVDQIMTPQIRASFNFATFKDSPIYPILLGQLNLDIGNHAAKLHIEHVFNQDFVIIQ